MAGSSSEYLFQQVTIIGVGLLGGSLGLVLKERGLAKTVVGIGRRQPNLELAVQVGAIDRFASDPQESVRDSDFIVLATPVDSYISHVQGWGPYVPSGAIVSDVGSVKGQLVFDLETALPSTAYFVGAHPIAGKEKSGVAWDALHCHAYSPHQRWGSGESARCMGKGCQMGKGRWWTQIGNGLQPFQGQRG